MKLEQIEIVREMLHSLNRHTSAAWEYESGGTYVAPLLQTENEYGIASLSLRLMFDDGRPPVRSPIEALEAAPTSSPGWSVHLVVHEGDGETMSACPVRFESCPRPDPEAAVSAACFALEALAAPVTSYYQSRHGQFRAQGECPICAKDFD